MKEAPVTSPPPGIAMQLDAACLRFEGAWRRGERPQVVEYLAGFEGQPRDFLVRELVALDAAYRRRLGEQPQAANYLDALPGDESAVRAAFAGNIPTPPNAASEGATLQHPDPPTGRAAAKAELDPSATAGGHAAEGPAVVPVIDGYEILEVLGRGGMGVVYKARQIRLNRLVAVKMILAGRQADAEERHRFRREAEAIARLQHPNIVQIHEIGETDNTPFFSLEYVSGGSLASQLDGTPWPVQRAAKLVEVLARANHAAHEQAVIHRDLKPANILLLPDGTPKITDFGLAKKLDDSTLQTQSGAIVGTPSYMAPEQASGQGRRIGPAADVYALGAILYELITGRPQFKAATALETVLQVLNEDPVPPRRLLPKIPADVETICLKCLEKLPGKRYASAAALAEDLRRFQAGEPIAARPVGALERTWRWCRRNRALAGALTLGVLSLVIGSMVALVFGFRAETARQSEANRAAGEALAKREADAARHVALQQLVDMCGASGITAAREGDHSLALLWFARALELAPDDSEQEHLNRIRIANWLRQVCLPEGSFTIPGFQQNKDRFRAFQFSPDGKYLLVVASTGGCLVWDRLQGRLVELPGAAAQGTAAAWQPESSRLAVAGPDGRIRLLASSDFRTAAEVVASGKIRVLAFSPDGKRLAVGGSEGARVWDMMENKYITPWFTHKGDVLSLSFSSNGERLATAARDGMARVFAVPSQQADPLFAPVPHTLGQSDFVHRGLGGLTPCFADGDQVLLTAPEAKSGTRYLVWRSASTGKEIMSSAGPPYPDPVMSFAVSPQGGHVAAAWNAGGRIWDARTRKLLTPLPEASTTSYEYLSFAADGKALVTCKDDSTVQLWSVPDSASEKLTAQFPPVFHTAQAVRASLTSDGRHLATAVWDGTVCLWRLPQGVPVTYSVSVGGGTLPALAPDQQLVLPQGVSHRFGKQIDTRVYQADSGKPVGPWLEPGGIHLNAAFSPDGALVATASSTARSYWQRNSRLFQPEGRAGNVQIWDYRSGKRIVGPIAMPSEPRGLAFRPDGSELAVVCADYHVLLLDPKAGTIIHSNLDPGIRTRKEGNANQWFSNGEARFSPNGRFLITWEMSAHVHVWDPDRGQLLHTLPHTERVHHVAFSPTEPEVMVTAGWGNNARIWNLATGNLLATLKHPVWPWQCRFSTDGTRLFTGALDGLFRVWDWRSEKPLGGWPLHSGMVHDFRFTADDQWLISLGSNHLQITDWRTKTPATPLWHLGPDLYLGLAVPSGDRRAIVGGFSGALMGYDLETMLTPITAPVEDVVRLAEATAGRRILSQGNILPLTGPEWAERWSQLQRGESPLLLEVLRPNPVRARQREVQRLVTGLFERLIRKSAVLSWLRQDAHLDDEVRATALAQAERYLEDAEQLNLQSWMVVRSAECSSKQYARALLQAEEACDLQPENGLALNTLGVAQYRMGKYQEALATLTRSEKINRTAAGRSAPSDLAFLCLAQHRLGMKQQALETFVRFQRTMRAVYPPAAAAKTADESTATDDHAFFQEAGEALFGQGWDPKHD
jgi:WD40 repeat protein/Flp pilus assembly protein TadD